MLTKLSYWLIRIAAWKLLFDSLWKDFELRFDSILDRLSQHRDLIDKEAVSFDIVQASRNRRKIDEELEKTEQERSNSHLQAVLSWLCVDDRQQEDDLWHLNQKRYPDTCQWLLETSKYQTWLSEHSQSPVVWLQGIPGSGMSYSFYSTLLSLKTMNARIMSLWRSQSPTSTFRGHLNKPQGKASFARILFKLCATFFPQWYYIISVTITKVVIEITAATYYVQSSLS